MLLYMWLLILLCVRVLPHYYLCVLIIGKAERAIHSEALAQGSSYCCVYVSSYYYVFVSSCYYMCVPHTRCARPPLRGAGGGVPHTAACLAFSYCHICSVRILHMCPHALRGAVPYIHMKRIYSIYNRANMSSISVSSYEELSQGCAHMEAATLLRLFKGFFKALLRLV